GPASWRVIKARPTPASGPPRPSSPTPRARSGRSRRPWAAHPGCSAATRAPLDPPAALADHALGRGDPPTRHDGRSRVSEAVDILRSYVRLVARLSQAASVSLYVPPGSAGEREILIHDGRLAPLPELATSASAAEFLARLGAESSGGDAMPLRFGSHSGDGVLYRIPLRWVMPRPDEEPG